MQRQRTWIPAMKIWCFSNWAKGDDNENGILLIAGHHCADLSSAFCRSHHAITLSCMRISTVELMVNDADWSWCEWFDLCQSFYLDALRLDLLTSIWSVRKLKPSTAVDSPKEWAASQGPREALRNYDECSDHDRLIFLSLARANKLRISSSSITFSIVFISFMVIFHEAKLQLSILFWAPIDVWTNKK